MEKVFIVFLGVLFSFILLDNECNKDAASDCKEREKNGECDSSNPKIEYYMRKNCVATCKYCDNAAKGTTLLVLSDHVAQHLHAEVILSFAL
ncbi:hypothetical protein P5673_011110 [Acropora cervicornis]|uniref:ShKT domain-containing protein n=1 Tax=Acropora cervicornis TaxID=6130 RepID=A0AAD9QPT6_ACRCE|nr:hypothetical protein P5673_011110 [Acropora cervicornis]